VLTHQKVDLRLRQPNDANIYRKINQTDKQTPRFRRSTSLCRDSAAPAKYVRAARLILRQDCFDVSPLWPHISLSASVANAPTMPTSFLWWPQHFNRPCVVLNSGAALAFNQDNRFKARKNKWRRYHSHVNVVLCYRNWLNFSPMVRFEIHRSQTTQINSSWAPVSLEGLLATYAHFTTVCADLRQSVRRFASMRSHRPSVVPWRLTDTSKDELWN
jgi:hypothetical protein